MNMALSSWTDKPDYESAPPVHLNPWYEGVYEEQRDGKHAIVYLLESGAFYKIGYTRKSVDERVRELQTGSAERITVVAVRAGGPSLEKSIHRRLESYRRSGEWFEKSELVASAFYDTPLNEEPPVDATAHDEPASLPLFDLGGAA